jgi:O-antigen ligase
MELPVIPINGMGGKFFQKLEYADMVLFLFVIIFVKNIFEWFKSSKNRKYQIILFALIISWIISSLFSFHKITSLADTLGLCMLIILFVLLKKVTFSYDMFIYVNKVNLYVAAFVSATGIIAFTLYFFCPHPFLANFILPTYTYYHSGSLFPYRAESFLLSPEMMISYLNVALVSGFIVFIHNMDKKILLCLVLIAVSAFLGLSRGLTGFFVTLSLIVFSFKLNSLFSKILAKMFYLSAIVLLGFAIIFTFYHRTSFEELSNAGAEKVAISHEKNYYLMRVALQIAADYPLLGIGPGNYSYELKNYIINIQPYYEGDVIPINYILTKSQLDPHCFYLGQISETGLIGFCLIVLFFCYILFENRKIINNYRSNIKVVKIHLFLEAGIIGLLVTGLFVDIFSMRHLWVLLAITCAAVNLNQDVKLKMINQKPIM